MNVLPNAATSEFLIACFNGSFSQSRVYHRLVKPSQMRNELLSVNEWATTNPIGMNRKA